MAKEKDIKTEIFSLLKNANKIPTTKEIKEDIRVVGEIVGKIGTKADQDKPFRRNNNVEMVEVALHRLLTHVNSDHVNPEELKLMLNYLNQVHHIFSQNLKNYHEHDVRLKERVGRLGDQLKHTIGDMKLHPTLKQSKK